MMIHSLDSMPPTLTAYLEADELENFERGGDVYERLVALVDSEQANSCFVTCGSWLNPGPAVAVILPSGGS